MSLWLRLSRADVAAALICLAMVAGFTWLRWAYLPDPDRPTGMAEATVVSIEYGVPQGRSGGQASASIRLRLDDGAQVSVRRKMRCLPAVHRGERGRVIGSQRNAGGTIWTIVGEPCPGDDY